MLGVLLPWLQDCSRKGWMAWPRRQGAASLGALALGPWGQTLQVKSGPAASDRSCKWGLKDACSAHPEAQGEGGPEKCSGSAWHSPIHPLFHSQPHQWHDVRPDGHHVSKSSFRRQTDVGWALGAIAHQRCDQGLIPHGQMDIQRHLTTGSLGRRWETKHVEHFLVSGTQQALKQCRPAL